MKNGGFIAKRVAISSDQKRRDNIRKTFRKSEGQKQKRTDSALFAQKRKLPMEPSVTSAIFARNGLIKNITIRARGFYGRRKGVVIFVESLR